jgi:dUTPase
VRITHEIILKLGGNIDSDWIKTMWTLYPLSKKGDQVVKKGDQVVETVEIVELLEGISQLMQAGAQVQDLEH